jgi:hypothetical protein
MQRKFGMGKRAQSQRHGELFAFLVHKPSWIAAACVRDDETDVQVVGPVSQSGNESFLGEIGNDDPMLYPEILRELSAERLDQGLAAGDMHNVDVRGGNLVCEFATDTGRGAGDERPGTKPLAVHFCLHFSRPPWAQLR